ncbi:FecR family protein [Membranihabitans marinus]|uniref:FecR family protein n=1 Tax=Membranihabitans marinus TaxID=1227546 RepID=UPI001F491BA3|nr:FecR domain-containing protein [Membranihabitans marinus]
MKNFERGKILFQKYLDRTADAGEIEEMFDILKDKSIFQNLTTSLKNEWEDKDVFFELDELSYESIRSDWANREEKSLPLKPRPTIRRIHWKFMAAASLLIIITTAIWIFVNNTSQVYETGFGETREILLSDHSRVTLNANSKMVWNENWLKKGQRDVELYGEAFFEVNRISSDHGSGKMDHEEFLPFRVKTRDLTVNVQGTSFNVQTRRAKTDVFLESGKVLLTLNKADKSSGAMLANISDSIYMSPGDKVSYSEQSMALTLSNDKTTIDEASWIQGSLIYQDVPLSHVLQELTDIYGKEFEVEEAELLNRKVDLGLPYADWKTLSGLMTLSLEIEIFEDNNKVIMQKIKGK